MAKTAYLVFQIDQAEDGERATWLCVDKRDANSPKAAIGDYIDEMLQVAPLDRYLCSWAAVPISNFHWFGARENRELILDPVEITPPPRQTELPIDDPKRAPRKRKTQPKETS